MVVVAALVVVAGVAGDDPELAPSQTIGVVSM